MSTNIQPIVTASGSALVDQRGVPLTKSVQDNMFMPFSTQTPNLRSLTGRANKLEYKGAVPNPRKDDWFLYLHMYLQHPVVFAAINKKVSVATNTGYDFVPRGRLQAEVPEDQAEIASNFFEGQVNLLAELRSAYLDLELMGDAFLYVIPDRRRQPKRLKRLPPWTVNIKAKKNGDVECYVQVVDAESVVFRPHEIIHVRHVNPDDDLYGLSRLEAVKQVVTSDLLAEDFNLNFFKNGASTGTMIIVKDASERELQMNAEWIRNEYVGTGNAFKPIVLAGDISVERSVASHQDMGFLQGRDQNKKAILAALDVPPAKIGDMESANRSNSKEQDKSFRTEAVMPLQGLMEDALSTFIRDILGCPDVLFRHSEGDIRDAQEQMDLWTDAAKTGFMTINEVRSKMGMVPLEGGDIAFVMTPTGAVPVTDLELYFQLPQTNEETYPLDQRTADKPVPGYGKRGTVPKASATNSSTVQGLPPSTSKSLDVVDEYVETVTKTNTTMNVNDLYQLLQKAKEDDTSLRHTYLNITELADSTQHPKFVDIQKNIRNALRNRDDTDLRIGYLERAEVGLSEMVLTIGNTQHGE